MIQRCEQQEEAPRLPATALAEACYQSMFSGIGLTQAPELPAINLEVMCYLYMFQNCAQLERAPVLPALKLDYYCYENMFSCRSWAGLK